MKIDDFQPGVSSFWNDPCSGFGIISVWDYLGGAFRCYNLDLVSQDSGPRAKGRHTVEILGAPHVTMLTRLSPILRTRKAKDCLETGGGAHWNQCIFPINVWMFRVPSSLDWFYLYTTRNDWTVLYLPDLHQEIQPRCLHSRCLAINFKDVFSQWQVCILSIVVAGCSLCAHGRLASSWASFGCTHMWMFPKIVGFPPKSSILIGSFILNHPFWGTPIFGNTHLVESQQPSHSIHLLDTLL